MLVNGTTEGCTNIFTLRFSLDGDDARKIALYNGLIIPANVLTNLLALLLLSKVKLLKQVRWRIYMRYLFISNLLLGVFAQPPITLLFTEYRDHHSCPIEMSTHYIYFLFSTSSGFIILAIGIDLLISQHNIFWYKYGLTRSRFILLTSGTVTLTLATCAAYIIGTIYKKFLYVKLALSTILFIATSLVLIKTLLARKRNAFVVFTKRGRDMQKQKAASERLCLLIEFFILSSVCASLYSVIVDAMNLDVVRNYRWIGQRRRAYFFYVSIIIITFCSTFNATAFLLRISPSCKGAFYRTLRRGNDSTKLPSNDTTITDGDEFGRQVRKD